MKKGSKKKDLKKPVRTLTRYFEMVQEWRRLKEQLHLKARKSGGK